jgi:hypothetical protein
VSEEVPLAPFVYDGLDPVPQPRPAIAEVTEALNWTVDRVTGAVDAARKPGMPLNNLANVVLEAPLGSLLVAFLLGVAVARRRAR